MNAKVKQELIDIYKSTPKCIEFGEFTLHSGVKSHVYIDSKQVTLNARGLQLIAAGLTELAYVCDAPVHAVGGMTLGADPLVSALLALSPIPDLRGFIIRRDNKGHGKGGRIAGPLRAKDNVMLVEDVTTSGATLLEAIDVVIGEGCKVVGCVSIVDRCQGGSQAIWDRGIPFMAILDAKDLGIEDAAA